MFICISKFVVIYQTGIPLQISSTKQGGLGSVQTAFLLW